MAGLMSAKRATETRAPDPRRVPRGRLPEPAALGGDLESLWRDVLARLRGAARSEPSTAVGVPRFGQLAEGMVIEGGW